MPKSHTLSKVLVVLIGFLALSYTHVYAARFVVSQDASSKKVGDTFRATVYLDTQGISANAGEASISFPSDKVEVESISTSNSIFSMWVEQPTYSNDIGVVRFNGGAPNPGYTGAQGRVLQINYRIKSPGTGSLSFGNASILANDGLGSDIHTQSPSSSFTIGETPVPQEETKPVQQAVTTSKAIPAPIISSKDVPDSSTWYSTNSATFSWNIPDGVTTVLTALDENPSGTPTREFTPAISTRTLSSFSEGRQYLHVRFSSASGRSPVTTYSFNIDTTAPRNLSLSAKTSSDGGTLLSFGAIDDVSGIASYTLGFDGKTPLRYEVEQSKTPLLLPLLEEGSHTATLQAYDLAGNVSQKSLSFSVGAPIAPKVSVRPRSIKAGQDLNISGTSAYANAQIRIWINTDDKDLLSYDVTTDTQGAFAYSLKNTQANNLIGVQAELVLGQDVRGPSSEEVIVPVSGISLLLIGLGIVLLLALLYISHIEYQLWKLRQEHDIDLREVDIDKELTSISLSIKNYVKILRVSTKRRKMTRVEETALGTTFDELTTAHSTLLKKLRKGKKK